MDLKKAIDSIWECKQQGIYYPSQWKGRFDVDTGYRLQLGILDKELRGGASQAGWKVGLTARAIQEQVGFHEPVFGYLLQGGALASEAALDFDDLVAPCVEFELCLEIGERLEGPGVTFEQARAAISGVAPGIEVVERRGDFIADPALSMADNVQQKAFVTGPFTRPVPHGLVLAGTRARISVNGEVAEEATGAEVLGDPAHSVEWLANRLAGFGKALEKGSLVFSGSFTRQFPINQGDYVEAEFEPFGRVALSIK